MKILFEKFVEKFVFDNEYICYYKAKSCLREIAIVTSKNLLILILNCYVYASYMKII